MCGIAGILKVWTPAERELALRTPHAQSIPEAWLDILDDSIRHRGPDGHGRFRDRTIRADGCVVDVALVHRRLSIIDHAGGHQPMVWLRGTGILPVTDVERYTARMATRDWSDAAADPESNHGQDARATDLIALVFNGCIYNHRQLRAELQKAGHVFSTDHSDTEVLVHGWREWGEEMFDHLEGMFAAAIWDGGTGSLALVRDPFGEKPLHLFHARRPGFWVNAFGSVPPAATSLAREVGVSEVPIPSASRVWHWLRFGFGNDAPLSGSREVAFSQAAVYSPAEAASTPTEAAPDREPPNPHTVLHGPLAAGGAYTLRNRDADWSVEEVEQALSDSVAARMEADVPLGCFLSGGVDSSLISLLAKRHAGHVRTFTVKMPFAEYDESPVARRVADLIGSEHATLECRPDPAEDLVHLIQQAGVPLGDSSLLPAYWVSRAAREHVKVVLSGDGGDELFCGYERYAAARWLVTGVPGAGVLGRVLRRGAAPKSRRSKLARFADAAGHLGYIDLLAIFPTSDLECLLPQGDERDSHEQWLKSARLHLNQAQAIAIDLFNYLPRDLLRKTDIASMAVALEVRAPFLDACLVRRATRVRLSSLMPHNQRKGLLRQVARKYLPAEIVDRPKMGFAIPIGEWFRSDYGGLRTMLLDHLNSAEPFGPPSLGIDLNMAFIRQMLDEHLGTGPSGLVKRDHSQRLYMLLVLSIWAKWIGSLR
jgi:asparagine synthase (glutamine-hydrolysing)